MRLTAFFTVGIFLLALGLGDAEARRFGGGGSKGTFSRQMSAPPKATPAAPAQTNKAGAAAAASNKSGLIGGLLAGGLLAALFFGGAFDNIQIMDILIIAAIAFGIIFFLRSRRRQAASNEQRENNYAFTQGAPAAEQQNQAFTAETFGATQQAPASHVEATVAAPEEEIIYGAPSWFDETNFLIGAKEHFVNLQKAWDAKDFASMQEYVTPQLYKFLVEERAKDTGEQTTQVVQLAAEVNNIQQLPSKVVELAIMFHGEISEDGQAPQRFCEIWHLIRDMNVENASWLIQGIEQVD